MAHTVIGRQKLQARVRRIRGQVGAMEHALETEAGGAEVLHLIARMRTDIARLMAEVVEHHIGTHLVDAETHPDALDADGVEDLLEVVHAFLK